jgi:hypothetical protein
MNKNLKKIIVGELINDITVVIFYILLIMEIVNIIEKMKFAGLIYSTRTILYLANQYLI